MMEARLLLILQRFPASCSNPQVIILIVEAVGGLVTGQQGIALLVRLTSSATQKEKEAADAAELVASGKVGSLKTPHQVDSLVQTCRCQFRCLPSAMQRAGLCCGWCPVPAVGCSSTE